MESGDRCVAVAVSAPGPAEKASAIQKDSIGALRSSFGKKVEPSPGPEQELSSLPTSSRIVDVKNSDGDPVRVIVSVSAGSKYAYLTQVVLRDPACEASQVEAQLILSALSLTK